jgi:hypothetical protein
VLDVMSEEPRGRSIAADVWVRTLWHSLYDQHRGTAEVSFYLGDEPDTGGVRCEHRSEYLSFGLDAY